MKEIFLDALIDSAKTAPLLFAIYFIIEALEYKFGGKIRSKIAAAGNLGPLIGTLFGLLPQCGFSVVGAALYTQRLISIGTLIAILLATSDEAIPIILSRPDSLPVLLPLLISKIIIALIGGYGVDLIFRKMRLAPDSCGHDHEHGEQLGCCDHDIAGGRRRRDIVLHPLRHTLTVLSFVFITTFALGLAIHSVGMGKIALLQGSIFQPVIAALVGLIPNCAASVAITQAFIAGGIGFGSTVAGLATSGGLGILVLFKENRSFKDFLRVVFVLFIIGVLSGIIIQAVWG